MFTAGADLAKLDQASEWRGCRNVFTLVHILDITQKIKSIGFLCVMAAYIGCVIYKVGPLGW